MGNKEFDREDLLKTIDEYYQGYKLPEMSISNGEWDAVLDNVKKCLQENNRVEFETAIKLVLRKAFNLAFLDDCDVITLYYVINALDDLKAFTISEETIKDLKFKIAMDGLKNNTKKENSKTK